MTPQEIHEYKIKWLMQCEYHVEINEDLDYSAKRWCRQNLKQHQWHFTSHTDIYAHTLSFETREFKLQFVNNFFKT